MENVILLVVVAMFLWFLYLNSKQTSDNHKEEKLMLIREMATAIKAETLTSYNDSLPEYEKPKEVKEIIKDDIVEIDQVEPDVLLRAISK